MARVIAKLNGLNIKVESNGDDFDLLIDDTADIIDDTYEEEFDKLLKAYFKDKKKNKLKGNFSDWLLSADLKGIF